MSDHDNNSEGLLRLFSRLFSHVSVRRRWQFLLMLGLTLVSSASEVISLGAVLPFIGILTQPEKVMGQPYMAWIMDLMGISSASGLVIPLTTAFAAAALLAAGLRLLLLWGSIRLANATGADLSLEVYRRTLYQPYRVHVARNSSEVISGITQKVSTATGVLISFVAVFTSAMLFFSILGTLFVIDPAIAAGAVVVFGAGYGAVAFMTSSRLNSNSRCIAGEQTQVVKALQEGLGAIRDVLLDGAQAVYCAVYDKAMRKLQRANGENSFLSQSPRYAMEALGMLLVAVLAYLLSERPGGIQSAMPLMAAMALGAQRLLPLLQQLYGNWSVVAGSRSSLVDVLTLLDQPLPPGAGLATPDPLGLKNEVRFEGVRFRYAKDGPWVLDGIDLSIPKGARVGFVGTTGSGKSTAIDLLMGLLDPTEGRIIIDGLPLGGPILRAWQRSISHVPQSIFLADSSIAENIAFGIPSSEIDMARVREAAERAQIAEFIESRPGGYTAMVGERGIRLSGGQRQRIGIARALYKRAQILVFDEATSALDTLTEKGLMDAIESLTGNFTVIMIAHRLTTLRSCDLIVRLESGRIVMRGVYGAFSEEAQAPDRMDSDSFSAEKGWE